MTPMTNCAQVYGGGKLKMVYMRDATSYFTQLLEWSDLAKSGFTSIEPLKTYQKEFSHYIDLKKHNTLFASMWSKTLHKLREMSSCGQWGSTYFGIYLDNTQPTADGNGWASSKDHYGGVIIQLGGYYNDLPYTAVHEFGHAFGDLADEYFDPRRNSIFGNNLIEIRKWLIPHCSFDPKKDYSAGGILYGGGASGTAFTGCTIDGTNAGARPQIYRPSGGSIMRTNIGPTGPIRSGNNARFNVVSCGYLLKYIKNTPTAKQNFAECAAMPGIIPVGQ